MRLHQRTEQMHFERSSDLILHAAKVVHFCAGEEADRFKILQMLLECSTGPRKLLNGLCVQHVWACTSCGKWRESTPFFCSSTLKWIYDL